jgi:hypothetical protein
MSEIDRVRSKESMEHSNAKYWMMCKDQGHMTNESDENEE